MAEGKPESCNHSLNVKGGQNEKEIILDSVRLYLHCRHGTRSLGGRSDENNKFEILYVFPTHIGSGIAVGAVLQGD